MPIPVRVLAENIRRTESKISIAKGKFIALTARVIAREDSVASRARRNVTIRRSCLKKVEWI